MLQEIECHQSDQCPAINPQNSNKLAQDYCPFVAPLVHSFVTKGPSMLSAFGRRRCQSALLHFRLCLHSGAMQLML